MSEERRVAIAAFNGCLKAKRNEFCLPCVEQATGYDREVTGDRRAAPHDYARTPDTSAKVDVEISSKATGIGYALWHMQYSLEKLKGWDDWDEKIINSMRAFLREVIDQVQSPRSDTSAVELVREIKGALITARSLRDGTGATRVEVINSTMDALTKAEQWLKNRGQ